MTERPAQTGSATADAAHVRGVLCVTWVSMGVNLALIVLKVIGGIVGNSKALLADAANSTADFVSGIAMLVGVRYWSASADENHPHGHRRIETIVATFIGGTMAAVGVGLVYDAIATWPARHDGPRWIAFWAEMATLASKETLYRWSVGVGRRVRSDAILALARDHRADAWCSIPAALAVALAVGLGPRWTFVDHIGAVVVSLFILKAAWDILLPAAMQLVDSGAQPAVRERITRVALGVEGVKLVHAVRTRYSGPGLHVDLHVKVDGTLSVRQGHDISEQVKLALSRDNPDIVDVVVHLEPYNGPKAERASS